MDGIYKLDQIPEVKMTDMALDSEQSGRSTSVDSVDSTGTADVRGVLCNEFVMVMTSHKITH